MMLPGPEVATAALIRAQEGRLVMTDQEVKGTEEQRNQRGILREQGTAELTEDNLSPQMTFTRILFLVTIDWRKLYLSSFDYIVVSKFGRVFTQHLKT